MEEDYCPPRLDEAKFIVVFASAVINLINAIHEDNLLITT
ncbi:MAG: hypothetical protein Tsb005_18860 [Gammaproteobacteria bacterium]